MRLGLVSDVHNHAAELCRALDLFRAHEVEQVVTIGDTYDAFAPPDGALEVAALLSACRAVGVWGNHDFALCRDVSVSQRARFKPTVLEFMRAMRPSLEIDGCYFSHKDASVDANDPLQLWSIEEEPLDLLARATAGLTTMPFDRQFVGHYHRWWAATPNGRINWDGSEPLLLQPGERYFVVVAAVFQGWCAVFDTASGVLRPLQCRAV
jgi:DNA repair exonuclease SbcCD nuclease subunit